MSAHPAVAPAPSLASRRPLAESPIRVVLADDHAATRRDLRRLLEREGGVEVIAEAGELSTAIRHVNGHIPHVLVLDLELPNGSSIETIRRLRAQVPETEIVVSTAEESPLFAQQALGAGAIGFVLKPQADVELVPAIRGAVRGESYVSPRVAAGLQAVRRAAAGEGLSPRETEIVRLIALGHTSAEIATRLHLSRRTVETHRARIYRKLGVSTRAEIVRYALRHGLLVP